MIKYKQLLAYIKLGIVTKLDSRLNLIIGILAIPFLCFSIEVVFWLGVFQASDRQTIGGFTSLQYITYLLWLMMQLGGANWRFERVMIMEINSGAVNSLLLRPASFFEYQLGQLLGYKAITVLVMLPIVLGVAAYWDLPLEISRLPPALFMGFCYVVMIHTLNFAVASMAFFFDYILSLNITKNMLIWFLAGELFPLDLLPQPFSTFLINSPFACGIYLPASYISGRITTAAFLHGFGILAIGTLFFGFIANSLWKRGLRQYSGTGA